MAPSYANLFVGELEPKLQAQAPHHINMWKRYIDDIFIIWTGSQTDLNTFMDKINSIHPTIKFTHECDDNELTFLDMTVYKGQNFHETGLLDIKTHINKQLYIHKSSYCILESVVLISTKFWHNVFSTSTTPPYSYLSISHRRDHTLPKNQL